jgi:hypothetical protein
MSGKNITFTFNTNSLASPADYFIYCSPSIKTQCDYIFSNSFTIEVVSPS